MFIATRLDVALAERLRYLIPVSYDRVMAYPHLLFPLSRKLEVLAPEVCLPGVGVLPDDFIMAVQTKPRFVEALMTVVATLNQQHRNVLDYVTAACEAALRGEPAPSFLPTPDVLNQGMCPAA